MLGSDLSRRVAVSAVIVAALAGALWADCLIGKDVCFNVLLAVVTVWAYGEFCDLCESWGVKVFRVLGMIACAALVGLHWLTLPHSLEDAAFLPFWLMEKSGPARLSPAVLNAFLVAVIFAVFLRQAFIKETRDALPAVALTLLGILYLWLLPSFLVRIRHLGGSDWLLVGNKLLISTLVVAKISDVGAYFVGRRFGRHKLVPRISPAKSVEGAVAGLLSSAGAAYALNALGLLPRIEGLYVPAFGLLAGAAGQCGDLLESLFKRSGGQKDSGSLLPGYGGILDVVDSLLVSAAPVYLFLRLAGGLEMRG